MARKAPRNAPTSAPKRNPRSSSRPRVNTEEKRYKGWMKKVHAANRAYEEWEKKFEVERLYLMYEGDQWDSTDTEDTTEMERYASNLFFPSVELRKPSLLFFRPRFKVAPRPPRVEGDPLTEAPKRARLREQVLNSYIEDRRFGFNLVSQLCLLEAHFRFGVIEVDLAADFNRNPKAGKPLTNADVDFPFFPDESVRDPDTGKEILAPQQMPQEMWVYIKRIPAKTWRVPHISKENTEENDWCGYYEWSRISDLIADDSLKNQSDLEAIAYDSDEDFSSTTAERENYTGYVKVWKIWHQREYKLLWFAEGHKKFLLEEPYEFLPFADLRFHPRLDTWYPKPVCYDWLPPQDSYNEGRHMQRIHRQRARRKLLYDAKIFGDKEIDQLESDNDQELIPVENFGANPEPVRPVPTTNLEHGVFQDIELAKRDFEEISGIGAEQRGLADAETATQASIVDVRSRIRENFGRVQVAEWLGMMGEKVLEETEELPLGVWLKIAVDPVSQGAQREAIEVAETYELIQVEDLMGGRFNVSVDIASLSPVSLEEERTSWNQVMQLFAIPGLVAVFALSETILRKTLMLYGIISEREIREIQRVAQLIFQAQQQAETPAETAPGVQPEPGPGPTPEIGEIFNQLAAQGLPVQ